MSIEMAKLEKMKAVATSGLDAPPEVVLELIGEIERLGRVAICVGCGVEGPRDVIVKHVKACPEAAQANPSCAYCGEQVADIAALRVHVEFCEKHPIARWKETAAEAQQSADYYRGLLVRCGEALGQAAKTQDDGGVVPDVLVAKVPELVEGLAAPKVEKLAALAHEQWSGWMMYLFTKTALRPDVDGVIIPTQFVQRWYRQMSTPYAGLPEVEKESDRVEARRVVATLRSET